MKRVSIVIVLIVWLVQFSNAATYHVDISGNDASGDGSPGKPWRTIRLALSKVPANQGHTIKISAGTFIEQGPLNVPLQVNIEGSGSSATIIKAASSFYYLQTSTSGFKTSNILIQLSSSSFSVGNQSLKNFTIDGDNRNLYGGIIVKGRSKVLIEGVNVQYCGFTGIWFWDAKDCRLTNAKLKDCAWFSSDYATASISISKVERIEIDHINVDETYGAAIKALGSPETAIHYCKIHDNFLSTDPTGRWEGWNGSTTPAIVLEMLDHDLVGNELYNNKFEGNVSLVCYKTKWRDPTGTPTIRVYNNVFDCVTRAKGNSYGLELSIHDVEIDHNYFYGGSWGITDWEHRGDIVPYQNWKIHHNIFYAIKGSTPGIIRTEHKGLRNLQFYNNTIELTGQKEVSVIQLVEGTSSNFKIKNNLIINNTTGPYTYYPPQFIRITANAKLTGLEATHNFLQNLPLGNVSGTYSNNLSGDPQINKNGNRPDPHYKLLAGSPCIDKGTNVGFPYAGSAPDIGALEYGSTTTPPPNVPPSVGLSSPTNNASFAAGSSITLTANAADPDGSITRVEFFSGATKLGEDTSGPYSFTWGNVAAGTYSITARATDNNGGTSVSVAVTIIIAAANKLPTVSITSPANNSNFGAGASITLTANASDSDGTISKVEFYYNNTKLGEDTSSPYSITWGNIPTGDYQVKAVAIDNRNGSATSSTVLISVGNVSNSLPVIALTSPNNNASFSSGSAITLTANATDNDGSISKVEFFNGSTKLGEDIASPYAFVWNNVPSGSYSLTAKATDNKNGVSTSSVVKINVTDNNKLPIVKITSPDDNSNFLAESSLVISVTATDNDGTISKVEFFNGATKIGEDTSSPYSMAWNNLKEGTYTLSAKATDNKGAVSTDDVTIFVNAVGSEPIANAGEDMIVELPENSILLQGYGEDTDGIIMNYTWEQVAGPSNATLTNNSTSSEVMVSDLVEGTYQFKLTVTDNGNFKGVDEVIVKVVPFSLTQVQLPRVFTPNDDGINDTWNWSNTEVFESCKLTIYNRFGQKIYESISYDNTWDGSINGSPLQEDAYYYVITCDNEDLTGAVRIVR